MTIKNFIANFARASLALTAIAAPSFVGANDCNWSCPPPCQPASCPPAPVCSAPQLPWAYNPPAYLKCASGTNNFFDTLGLRVDALYWRPSVDNLALGAEYTINPYQSGQSNVNPSPAAISSYQKRPDFSFDAGFRLGLTHFSPCDCWDVEATWTHYHSKASVSGSSLNLGSEGEPNTTYTAFVPYWEGVVYNWESFIPDTSEGRWTLTTDWVDLVVGHKYYVSSCFVARPNLGLRFARINQSFHVENIANRAPNGTFNEENFTSYVDAKSDFLGVGPRLGLDLEFDIGCGFTLVGGAGASILFGKDKSHTNESFSSSSISVADVSAANLSFKGTHDSISRTMSDLAIGIKWDHCVCMCNAYYPVSVAVLWEHHGFYDFNSFVSNTGAYDVDIFNLSNNGSASTGDMYTQGLTVAFNFGF